MAMTDEDWREYDRLERVRKAEQIERRRAYDRERGRRKIISRNELVAEGERQAQMSEADLRAWRLNRDLVGG